MLMHKIKYMRCYVRKDIHEITFWICNPNKTGGSGFRHLSGQNRKFRFLKPAVPVSAGLCQGVRGARVRAQRPRRRRKAARRGRAREGQGAHARRVPDGGESHRRRHGRVPAVEQGRSGPEEVRTGCSRARRSSPHKWTARRGDEETPRRRRAVAGEGARRRPCTANEEAR